MNFILQSHVIQRKVLVLLSDNYLYAFSYNDVLYYAQDEYESGKDGNLYATVYYVDSDNKSQLVDNDVLEGVIQELK